MNKKKELILKVARTLFNEKGYHNVTVRMIALNNEMSSGNLNYHFKKREDIFESLYFEMVSVFDARIESLNDIEVSLTQIRNDVDLSMRRMLAYQFFWTDLYNLLSISIKVKEHFQLVHKNRIAGCKLLFQKLIQKGLMRTSSYKNEYNILAERMINHGNTWLYSSRLYSNEINDINYQVNLYLTIFYPFLTGKGKRAFKELFPELLG